MNIIFAGTPEFAAKALAALLTTEHRIVAVYTQPDRKAGRGQKLTPSQVKQLALEHDIPVFQPENFKSSSEEGQAAQQQLIDLNADIMVVAAYGLILPETVLNAPTYGCLNIHASLLPRWRGAAPIQRAIAAGDTQTGVTIMQMAAGLDTGDMLYKSFCPIENHDTGATLYLKLAEQGAQAICKVLESSQSLESFLHTRQEQDQATATYANKLSKDEARIDWSHSAEEIDHQIRAFNPWPVAFTHVNPEERIRVWMSSLSEVANSTLAAAGTIIEVNSEGVHVACAEGVICLTTLQWSGGRALNSVQILQTQKLASGQCLI